MNSKAKKKVGLNAIRLAVVDVARAYQGQGEQLSELSRLLEPHNVSGVKRSPDHILCWRAMSALLEVHRVYGERMKTAILALDTFVGGLEHLVSLMMEDEDVEITSIPSHYKSEIER